MKSKNFNVVTIWFGFFWFIDNTDEKKKIFSLDFKSDRENKS